MEWLVLVVLVLLAALLIALPRRTGSDAGADAEREQAALIEERRLLLAELRELDEDAAAGRISGEDRLAGRRALAPRLRAVTEILQASGVDMSVTR
jgi:hypothetical protein